MITLIRTIQPIQVFFIPAFLAITIFLLYRIIFKKDKPAGLALYLSLVVIADGYMATGIFMPGLERGSIKFSEVMWIILFLQDKDLRSGLQDPLRKKLLFIFFLFFATLLIAAFNGYTLRHGIFFFRGQVFPQILAFILALTGFRNEDDYVLFFKYLIILVAICALYVLWLQFNNVTIIKSPTMYSPQFSRNVARGRHGSVFGNPNYLGCFIVLLLPVYITQILRSKKDIYLYLPTILVLIYLFSQTGSRGPIIACAFSLLILSLIKIKDTIRFIPMIIVMAIIFSLTMPGVIETLTRRFFTEEINLSMEEETEEITRGVIWRVTLEMIQIHPWGIGLGEEKFQQLAYLHLDATDFSYSGAFVLDNPHNSYLNIAISGGLQSLFFFLLILFIFFKSSLQMVNVDGLEIFAGMFIGLLGYCVAMISEPVMFKPFISNFFWINLGLCTSIIIRYKETGFFGFNSTL